MQIMIEMQNQKQITAFIAMMSEEMLNMRVV